jgi:hypothetical protein
MVAVSVQVAVVDTCDPSPVCRITAVGSSESIDGVGDGATSPDWNITGDLVVELRAERSGKKTGRVYTLQVTCTDASNLSDQTQVEVTVAHDRRR